MMEDKPCTLCGCTHHWEATQAMGGWDVRGELIPPDKSGDNPRTAAHNVPSEAGARIVGYNLCERLCLARRLAQQKVHTQTVTELMLAADEDNTRLNELLKIEKAHTQAALELAEAVEVERDEAQERAEESEVTCAELVQSIRLVRGAFDDTHMDPEDSDNTTQIVALGKLIAEAEVIADGPNPGKLILDRLKAAEKAQSELLTTCHNATAALAMAGMSITGVGVASVDKVIAVVRKSLEAAIAATGKPLPSKEEPKCPNE